MICMCCCDGLSSDEDDIFSALKFEVDCLLIKLS